MTSSYPFEIHDVNEVERKLAAEVYKKFKEKDGVRVGPKGYYFIKSIYEYGPRLYNLSARSSDVWLTGYHRSGTTLASEMIWLIGNDLNYEAAAKTVVDQRFAFIDMELYFEKEKPVPIETKTVDQNTGNIMKDYKKNSLDYQDQRSDQRFIKTHLPLSLCPANLFSSGAKIIYCARNPRDVIVSSYKVLKLYGISDQAVQFEKFWEAIKKDIGGGLPYLEHVKEGWSKRNEPNVLFLLYEDVVKDKKSAIRKVANFLGKKLSDADVHILEEHLSLENFKNNASVNNEHYVKAGIYKPSSDNTFIRKSESGGWRSYFVGHLEKEVDEWLENNLKGTGLLFSEK